ncbi:hypothetical protein RhiirB3_95839 [Rhizophagus irregularis]|nr:hypothetical protein RhiirB3_95839 [Rhizophagus irregularis]
MKFSLLGNFGWILTIIYRLCYLFMLFVGVCETLVLHFCNCPAFSIAAFFYKSFFYTQ